MTFFQSPILKNKSQKFNDLNSLGNDDMVILSQTRLFDSPQIIQICHQNESVVAVYSWDKYIRIFKINDQSLDNIAQIKINDYILDMIFIHETQILASTCQGQLIVINIQYQKLSSSSTHYMNNVQYSFKILMQNCVITNIKFFFDEKILVMFGLTNELVFYQKQEKLKRLTTMSFLSKIVDMQADIDELFVLIEDGRFYNFEIKDCNQIQLQNLPEFRTQIQYFDNLNTFDCENKTICIANSKGHIEIIQLNQWKNITQQKIVERNLVNINFNFQNEKLTSIKFLIFTETCFMVLTNHGSIQIWDFIKREPLYFYSLNYRTVCQATEEMGKWMIIGFGYDWSDGIEGTKDVNYRPCVAYFDTEELIPLDIELNEEE